MPENLIQDRKPKKGDLISFFHAELNCWVDAKITQDLSRKWKNYFNIVYDDNREDGLYLIKDTRWTFRNPQNQDVELPRCSEHSNSLKPTPETTPTQLDQTEEHDQANLSIDASNASYSNSLNWDLLGTQLDLSPNPSENPFSWQPSNCENLDQVNNFAYMLPLTSTPTRPGAIDYETNENIHFSSDSSLPSDPPSPASHTSPLNRSLPLELSRSTHCGSAFLRRFNFFKRKDR